MLDYILFFLFILYIAFLPTCDSYKCGGVAVWRCGGQRRCYPWFSLPSVA